MIDKLNLSYKKEVERALLIDRIIGTNIYDSLDIYCNNNNVKLTEEEFDTIAILISNFGIADYEQDIYYFWLDY